MPYASIIASSLQLNACAPPLSPNARRIIATIISLAAKTLRDRDRDISALPPAVPALFSFAIHPSRIATERELRNASSSESEFASHRLPKIVISAPVSTLISGWSLVQRPP
jgi:hypothetical protein